MPVKRSVAMISEELEKLKSGTDVRGVAVGGVLPVTLTDCAVTLVTKGFFKWLFERTPAKNNGGKLKIAVGNDPRISSPHISKLVCDALLSCGCDVVYTGLCSTPSMFMLLKKSDLGCDASVMITASHMPSDRNGLKFFTPDGGLGGKDIDAVLNLAAEENFPQGKGDLFEHSYLDEYAELLKCEVESVCGKNPLKGMKIIVDAGNGAGGFFAEKVLEPLGADTDGSQFLEPDGNFPNHIPNPEDKTAIESLSKAVIKNGADLGVIFDTDVDRAACVDKAGREINRNALIALVSAILLKDRRGVIVTDSVASRHLTEFIEGLGGKHLRYKRGYRNVIDKCAELNAGGIYSPLAIETSGHAAFLDNYMLDDGAYLITRLLVSAALLKRAGGYLTDLISDFKFPAEEAEIRVSFNSKSEDFRSEGEKVIENLKSAACSIAGASLADDNYEGVRVYFGKGYGDGWLLVRRSVHDPVLPINFESDILGGNHKIAENLYVFLKNYEFLDLSRLEKFIAV